MEYCTVHKIWTGFRIQDSGFRIQDSGFRIQDSGFRIQDSGFRIQDSGLMRQGPGPRPQGPAGAQGFTVWRLVSSEYDCTCSYNHSSISQQQIHLSNEISGIIDEIVSKAQLIIEIILMTANFDD
ncbi:unnamed protein product [Ambrosiozyma monospora]|uniref:Unnamed protein product n=1 Tax=Ambrosiozyma monospora TaxID=43982 RepID=A0A9W6YNX9_AMBMO|nr:unnamed protein product [Ambrosiozyma monospora]